MTEIKHHTEAWYNDIRCPIATNLSLKERTYYRIGGVARYVATPTSLTELAELLHVVQQKRLPLALIGGTTNSLFSDEPFEGVVLSLAEMVRMVWLSDDELFCEAGVENSHIAQALFEAAKSGGEWLHRLPGQIGATVRMNARCFGGEISAVTAAVLTLSLSGELHWQEPSEIFQGYKQTSLMATSAIVVGVLLRFTESNDAAAIRTAMEGYEAERVARHHFDYPSCGSTFKNNYSAGRSSGAIFDELGLRGKRVGGAVVSNHHANFIFNDNHATATDVLTLAAEMRQAALERAGVPLDLEVECIGCFKRTLLEQCGVPSQPDLNDSSKAWAGMLWLPEELSSATSSISIIEPSYPRQLMRGMLMGYSGLDKEFPTGIVVEVEQLSSRQQALAHPSAPFLRWRTYASAESPLFNLKPIEAVGFTDALWRYGVSELFISSTENKGYLEFEMTPQAHWVALQFSAPRQRAVGYETLQAEQWQSGVTLLQGEGWFGMELSWERLAPFVSADGMIALQCAASSGQGEFGLFPLWNMPSTPTNFHQPSLFYPIKLV